jgi:hypothetical protein
MLLELRLSDVAREGLEAACEAIVALLAHLATEAATVESVDTTIWPHGGLNKQELEAVLALPAQQRERLHDAVRADLRFAEEFGSSDFAFLFPELEETIKQAAKPLLISMYERVFKQKQKGFLFGAQGVANRTTWERDFHAFNPDLEVCPACTIEVLERPVGVLTLADADHYLPKSSYPPLAVHGLNLVLLCKSCNGILKGNKDPLGSDSDRHRLSDVWFPYRRAGAPEMVLSFDPERPVEKRLAYAGSADSARRAQRFDSIFRLLQRWNVLIDRYLERLPHELFRYQGPSPRPVDSAAVRATLTNLRADVWALRSNDPRAFLKSHCLDWLLEDEIAVEALVPQVNRLIAAGASESP